MKLLISTPAFGGLVHVKYAEALMESVIKIQEEGIAECCHVHYQTSESLIHRARDRAADCFIRGDYDKLITIDADIQWRYEDFKNLVTATKDLVGGAYAIKAFPVVMNFNALPDRGRELISSERGMDYDAFKIFCDVYGKEDPLVEVYHLATGFLCVTRKVFEEMRKVSKSYWTRDSVTGEQKGFIHFYESGVFEGQLESEDWSFVRRARELGFFPYLDTRIRLGHIGSHTYKLGQFFGHAAE